MEWSSQKGGWSLEMRVSSLENGRWILENEVSGSENGGWSTLQKRVWS